MPNVHKQEVTSVLICREETKGAGSMGPLMFVTTSLDGFIKMHSATDLQTKKSFFVC